MMDWHKLFSKDRLERSSASAEKGRNPFQQDLDRIVFSGSFRRLANKTQVHPLAVNDLIHNRLTHSVETGSVGRSLGTIVGTRVIEEKGLGNITADEFGYVVQAACLAHDIGNPPFGHAGEESIGLWFKQEFADKMSVFSNIPSEKQREFRKFEGNAQGFRILTQLENYKFGGGLQLTKAILGTFTKYPRSGYLPHTNPGDYVGGKKFGYFASEKKYFDNIAEALGLIELGAQAEGYYCRHPLAFLVEAADDICYNIVDLEDAVINRDLRYADVVKKLSAIAGETTLKGKDAENIAYLRAKAIGNSVQECVELFMLNYDDIMNGKYSVSLTDDPNYKYHSEFSNIRKLSRERIFTGPRKTELEIAGHKIIYGLLDVFKPVIKELESNKWDADRLGGNSNRLVRLAELDFSNSKDLYSATHIITDFVSGMTDRYAADIYKKLSGYI